MSSGQGGHFEILDGFPADVVAISAKGHITRKDYEDVLIPLVEERIRKEGKIKLLYVIDKGFEGFSAGAAWDDTKLGLLHMGDFSRIAVVTDVEWIRMGMKVFAPMIRCQVHLFGSDEMKAAKAWISEYHDAPPHEAQVAADHKIPTLEDKIPPED
ncbi:MAG: STAS/SEC14 domain-containing protein [Paracoccaceae bacterium]